MGWGGVNKALNWEWGLDLTQLKLAVTLAGGFPSLDLIFPICNVQRLGGLREQSSPKFLRLRGLRVCQGGSRRLYPPLIPSQVPSPHPKKTEQLIFWRVLWMELLFKNCNISRIREFLPSLMLCVLLWESCDIHPGEAAQGEGSGSWLSEPSCLFPPPPGVSVTSSSMGVPDVSGSVYSKAQVGAWLWIEVEWEMDLGEVEAGDHTSQVTAFTPQWFTHQQRITDQLLHLGLGFALLSAAAPPWPLPVFLLRPLYWQTRKGQ